MKITNYVVLFMIVFIGVISVLDFKSQNLQTMSALSVQYNKNMDLAIDEAVGNIVEADDGTVQINKNECAEDFYHSLFASFNALDNPALQEELQVYVPALAIADNDGLQVLHNVYTNHKLTQQWSQEFPYTYTGVSDSITRYKFTVNFRLDTTVQVIIVGCNTIFEGPYDKLLSMYGSMANSGNATDQAEFLALKTVYNGSFLCKGGYYEYYKAQAITDCVTEKIGYYADRNNDVASAYGIQYTFSLPQTAGSDTLRSVNDITFFALFQGFPYGIGTDDSFSKFAFSGARILKGDSYYVRKDPTSGLMYYHTSRCKLGVVDNTGDNVFDSAKDAAATGALPCPYCKP